MSALFRRSQPVRPVSSPGEGIDHGMKFPLAGGLPALPAARARARGRKPKMTPELTDKAQRMYDSKQFSMAEIAQY